MISLPTAVLGLLTLSSGLVRADFKQNIDEFSFSCSLLTTQRSDPIVSPGVPSGHVHAIVGGTAFNRTMTNSEATTSINTTCDHILDKSNYWAPQLYHIRTDNKFELVQMSGIAAYYFNRACDYDGTSNACNKSIFPAPPPAGLRMVSGNYTLRSYNSSDITQRAISHMCLTNGNSYQTPSLPTQQCLRIRAQVTFPPCWDGQNLDSADHKSHMAFPATGDYNGGRCPQSHPKALIQIFNEFYFETSSYSDRNFVYAMGDKTGYGLHADFINGWTDLNRLGDALRTCTGDQGLNDPQCSINVPGNHPAQNFPPQVPAPYEEEIGLNGPISSLPGNNPVTGTTPS